MKFFEEEDTKVLLILYIMAATISISFIILISGCATKQENNGSFKCNCDCKENRFECDLQIDKLTKVLHKEGEDQDGKSNN